MADGEVSDEEPEERGFPRAQVVLLLEGAIAGTVGDQIHVQLGVLWYPHPFLLGQAIWVPFLMGGAGLLLVHGHARVAERMGDGERPPRARVVIPAAWFFAAYLSTGLFIAWPRMLALGLALAWAARMLAARNRTLVVYSLLCALGGPLFERVL